MHEVYCTDEVLNKIDYAEMEDNYNLRKIAIQLSKKKRINKIGTIRYLAEHIYPKLKNLVNAEISLFEYYIPLTLKALNKKMEFLTIHVEGENMDFIEDLKHFKVLKTLKIYMDPKLYC